MKPPFLENPGADAILSYVYDADGGRYRAYVVRGMPEGGSLVAVRPCGKAERQWYVFETDVPRVLMQGYVAEKFGYQVDHVDAYNLTVLLGVALNRAVGLIAPRSYEDDEEHPGIPYSDLLPPEAP